MSILIRGMDMPKRGCDRCFLRTGNYCSRLEENESVITYAVKEKRHPNCPLVEVPKHGRLIDADDLVLEIAKGTLRFTKSATDGAYIEGLNRAIIETGNAPTVIESEE